MGTHDGTAIPHFFNETDGQHICQQLYSKIKRNQQRNLSKGNPVAFLEK